MKAIVLGLVVALSVTSFAQDHGANNDPFKVKLGDLEIQGVSAVLFKPLESAAKKLEEVEKKRGFDPAMMTPTQHAVVALEIVQNEKLSDHYLVGFHQLAIGVRYLNADKDLFENKDTKLEMEAAAKISREIQKIIGKKMAWSDMAWDVEYLPHNQVSSFVKALGEALGKAISEGLKPVVEEGLNKSLENPEVEKALDKVADGQEIAPVEPKVETPAPVPQPNKIPKVNKRRK